jgi:hypothetical protein
MRSAAVSQRFSDRTLLGREGGIIAIMNLRDRIGYDAGGTPLEDALAWAAAHLGWAFTVNHANLVPEGIDGFIDAFGVRRMGEVRLADNLGDKEVHLKPGEGISILRRCSTGWSPPATRVIT